MWTVRRVHCMRTLLAILFTPPPHHPTHIAAGREGRRRTSSLSQRQGARAATILAFSSCPLTPQQGARVARGLADRHNMHSRAQRPQQLSPSYIFPSHCSRARGAAAIREMRTGYVRRVKQVVVLGATGSSASPMPPAAAAT